MKTHDLIQGTPAWLAYRTSHFNASDAPAMLGCSPYKTRAQLLREMHTGVPAEVDAGTQMRFNNGHRAEALARPLAEEIVGEDLFPVVGSEGSLSASFDGLTLLEDTGFEHKALNAKNWSKIKKHGVKEASPVYYAQMQVYSAYMELPAFVFTATNKNTQELNHELVPYVPAEAQKQSDKAVTVIRAVEAGELLPRCTDNDEYWICKWCDWRFRCWNGDV